jgi:hypothetical protein
MGKLTKGNVDARVANARRLVGEAVRYLVPITRSQEPGKTRAEVARVVGRLATIQGRIGRIGDKGAVATRVHRRHGAH